MTSAELTATLQSRDFKFKTVRCHAENISLKEAEFLRFLLCNAPAANSEVARFRPGLAYRIVRLGYVINPLGGKGDAETNLWMLTTTGVELLKRLVA